ncbi:hypothetical protein B9Q02_08380 [Candidatus Marsarchaeota G1 archaeon BE_D]|uniref:Uncharacterized protein n=1 Tax=Candidatus Marsarchaeota G1 archaeon BE_D TaxID=1978156 RepID=A0A2R6AEU5_9ARCH|nr:MAG: hypothetical protein B9Q02_08380 [Candidatus Marsarchaeota G1 archaeon BE_D]
MKETFFLKLCSTPILSRERSSGFGCSPSLEVECSGVKKVEASRRHRAIAVNCGGRPVYVQWTL